MTATAARRRGGDDDRGTLVLAVDCSTTASKAVVFDPTGETRATARRPVSTSQPAPGSHEQHAADWWRATREAIAAAVADIDARRIAALCITHQRETFVCTDAEGRQLRPAILWVDSRARRQVTEQGSEEVHAISGRPPDTTPSFYKLCWLKEHEPQVLEESRHVADVPAYLHYQLIGRWVSSWASADSTGLMDMTTHTWSERLCEIAGVRREQLPALAAPGDILGVLSPAVASTLGLRAGIPVIAGAGDGQCAALGAGAIEPGRIYLNMGTACVTGYHSPTYSWSRAYRTLAGADGRSYLLEGLLSSGTYLVDWFREQFGAVLGEAAGQEAAELEAAASKVPPGSDGLLALPYWNAAQCPYWDPHASGAVIGWNGYHGPAHFYRALLEGVAYELRLIVEGLCEATGSSSGQFTVTGGGSRSECWSQIVADVTGRQLSICAQPETTALGAAMVAAAAAGLYPDPRAAAKAMSCQAATVQPDPDGHRFYSGQFAAYRAIYPALQPVLEKLSKSRNAEVPEAPRSR